MTTQTVVYVDLTTVTDQLDMMLANQQVSLETLGFHTGITIVVLLSLVSIFWVGLRR